MDCNDIQSRLTEYLDGQLDETQAVAVRAHLQQCLACRTEEEQLALLHTELKHEFARDRELADAIADRVLEDVALHGPVAPGAPAAVRKRQWWRYLASAAAGFLLALLLMRGADMSHEDVTAGASGPPGNSLPEIPAASATSPPARLVKATGTVSVRTPDENDWVSLSPPQLSVFTCPSDASVRTDPGVVCELETSRGCVVRMNESCEIKLLAEDELELVQGQVWCRASDNSSLKVVNAQQPAATPPAHVGPWMLTCHTNTESFASCSPSEPLQVIAAAGEVDVRRNGTEQTLPPGTFYSVSDGEVKVWESSHDLLTTERWMQPLLTLSGHGNPELTRRVDALLAHVGRTKLSHLFEQDLRSLGEYGALPLLKFTVAEESAGEPERRRLAMSILADTGPVWMAPDFVGLLEDDDPEVRFQAARGLRRLTGETQGLEPGEWKNDRSELGEAVSEWKSWWQSNRPNWPVPPPATWELAPDGKAGR